MFSLQAWHFSSPVHIFIAFSQSNITWELEWRMGSQTSQVNLRPYFKVNFVQNREIHCEMLVKKRFRLDLTVFCLSLLTWITGIIKSFLHPEGNGQFCLMNSIMVLSIKYWINSTPIHQFSSICAILFSPWKFISVHEYWELMRILCT